MIIKPIDIALIQPPGWANQNPPLGLALLKSYLTQQGVNVRIYDLNMVLYNLRHGEFKDCWDTSRGYFLWERESFVNKLFSYYSHEILNFIYSVLSTNASVIGLSSHCSSYISARLMAQKFKQYSPETNIVFGGPQVASYTSNWRKLFLSNYVDAVVFGEGEASLSEYLTTDDRLHENPIAGVAYKAAKGNLILGGERELIPRLDDLPFADFSDFDLRFYAGVNVLPTYFSRGCINNCIYCTENKFFPKFRNRSGKRVYDEITHQLELYPKTEYFRLHDSISNGNIKELEKLCDLLIDNKCNIRFNLENAIVRKEMDSRLHKKLKKAGCTLIGYGLETPSKNLLKQIGKGACLDADFDKVIYEGVRSKMVIGVNMMFGLPGETDNDFQQQLDFLRRHKRHAGKIMINPALNYCYFPEGCAVNKDPLKYGVDLSGSEIYWASVDGKNTFLERLNRFEKFCSLANEMGYQNLFDITESVNKEEMLGNYYISQGELETALIHLRKSFNKEGRTLELANSILEQYEAIGLLKDDFFVQVSEFMAKSCKVELSWFSAPNSRVELEEFLLTSSVVEGINRLNVILETMYDSSVKFEFSISGLKRYIFKIIQNLFLRNDRKYILILQALKDIDNKISIVNGIQRNASAKSSTSKTV